MDRYPDVMYNLGNTRYNKRDMVLEVLQAEHREEHPETDLRFNRYVGAPTLMVHLDIKEYTVIEVG